MLFQKYISQITPQLMLDNDEIGRVDSFNFLGVTIDKHLNWKQHTEIIAISYPNIVAFLSKLKNYLPPYIMRTLYSVWFSPTWILDLYYGVTIAIA